MSKTNGNLLRNIKLIAIYSLFAIFGYVSAGNIFFIAKCDSKILHIFFKLAPDIKFGLDIRGGSQLILDVDFQKFLSSKYDSILHSIRTGLMENNIPYSELFLYENNFGVYINAKSGRDNMYRIKKIIEKVDSDLKIEEKLLDKSGIQIIVSYDKNDVAHLQNMVIEKSLRIIRNRIDSSGTKEILLQRSGQSRIILDVPDVQNPEQIKNSLGRTAKLSFHLLDREIPLSTKPIKYIPIENVVLRGFDGKQEIYYNVKRNAEIGGDELLDARVNTENFKISITLKLNNVGTKKLAELSYNNVGHPLAIVLDDIVLTAPIINEPIVGGSASITGTFSRDEAIELSNMIRSGSLPAPINIIGERSIGPSLGTDTLRTAGIAFALGIGLVLLFMITYYRKLGIIASVSILLNFIMVTSIIAICNVTLTLPGIAGLILTLGMAVDANVLIYERMRDEVKSKIKNNIEIARRGCAGALTAIIDSNITTILSAITLITIGTGFVRGFAISLTIGIICSLFTNVIVTKMMIERLASKMKNRLII